MTKILQILLVAAIFNPLCCCDAAFGVTVNANESKTAHSCCEGPKGESGQKKGQDHGRENCPHQMGNGYKQASWDHLNLNDFGIQPVALGWQEIISVDFDYTRELVFRSPFYNRTTSRGPPGLYRKNCAYLI